MRGGSRRSWDRARWRGRTPTARARSQPWRTRRCLDRVSRRLREQREQEDGDHGRYDCADFDGAQGKCESLSRARPRSIPGLAATGLATVSAFLTPTDTRPPYWPPNPSSQAPLREPHPTTEVSDLRVVIIGRPKADRALKYASSLPVRAAACSVRICTVSILFACTRMLLPQQASDPSDTGQGLLR